MKSCILLISLLLAPGPLRSADGSLSLEVAWNNPFNPSLGEETRFEYSLRDREAAVRLAILSADGRLVALLAEHDATPGTLYTQTWNGLNRDGRPVESGVYFVVLDAGRGDRTVRRVAVLRE